MLKTQGATGTAAGAGQGWRQPGFTALARARRATRERRAEAPGSDRHTFRAVSPNSVWWELLSFGVPCRPVGVEDETAYRGPPDRSSSSDQRLGLVPLR